ncbi:MAG: VOC family protein [Pseudomonadota bacterium]
MIPHGTFVWNELMTRDVDAAKRFYEASLGWTFDAMPMPEGGTYWVASSGGSMAGGMMALDGPQFEGVPSHWFAYIEVDDVDARVAGLEQAGGKLMRPAFDVANVGRIAIVQDPTGAVVGWMTSVDRAADWDDDEDDDGD